MEKYLTALYKKPDHHKRRFALLVSGTVTLFIFGVWSLATFGTNNNKVIVTSNNEVSPLQSLNSSLAASLEALRENFKELKDGVSNIYGR
ncbi:MAG: hypothetical protein Q8Q92_04410 [bacterium]|nr:hypothetical protein [bacterium]